MNWDAIGAVAEIAGVLAVVVSVLYLAKQVKVGNDLNRTNTFRSIFQGMAAYSTEMFSPENAELMVKGYADFQSLTPVEKLRFENLLAHLFNYAEDSYNSAEVGLLGHDTIENWSWYMRTRLFPYQGVKDWWATYREGYPPDIRKWVDDVARDSDSSEDAYGIIDPEH
jgi:hypothetical protein